MSRLCLYFRREPERNRWVRGDRFVRPLVRRAIRGKSRPGGIDKVFLNLRLGLDRIGVPYEVNLPFSSLRDDDRVGVIGVGRYALEGYHRRNPLVAGVALMAHPNEWPTLCHDYSIAAYLQHSEWVNEIYRRCFGDHCRIWPVGIDTAAWSPTSVPKTCDFLLYDKIMWEREKMVPILLDPIRSELARRGLSYTELRYGDYTPQQYRDGLRDARAMIFLCEHESQGIGYLEALSSGVPILAWDQGRWLDPNRFAWGDPEVAATSVPYFDERCGLRFRDVSEFSPQLSKFLELVSSAVLAPRDYVLENLTLEKCAQAYLRLFALADGRNGI